jgi:hypothetical protein
MALKFALGAIFWAGRAALQFAEEVVKDARHQARMQANSLILSQLAEHCVRLSAACLPIGKDAGVVALEAVGDDSPSSFCIEH